MPDWSCRKCGAINLEGQRVCEGCGAENRGASPRATPPTPKHMAQGAPPCTLEQNRAALKITLDVHKGLISAEEGRRQLVELFRMPELEHER